MSIATDHEGDIIKTQINGMYYPSKLPEKIYSRNVINGIGNDPLFQAITAMRDDNHIHQWHIIDYDVYLDMPKDYWFIATDLSGGKHVGCQIDPMYCHKATLSELQAHFKHV